MDPFQPGMGVERKPPATAGLAKVTAGRGGAAPTAERSPIGIEYARNGQRELADNTNLWSRFTI